MRIGEVLISTGRITSAALEQALGEQRLSGGRIGTNLVELELITLDDLAAALARQHEVPAASVAHFLAADERCLARVPRALCERYGVFPLHVGLRGEVRLAMQDPRNFEHVDAVRFAVGARVEPWVAPELRLWSFLERRCGVVRPPRLLRLAHLDEEEPTGSGEPLAVGAGGGAVAPRGAPATSAEDVVALVIEAEPEDPDDDEPEGVPDALAPLLHAAAPGRAPRPTGPVAPAAVPGRTPRPTGPTFPAVIARSPTPAGPAARQPGLASPVGAAPRSARPMGPAPSVPVPGPAVRTSALTEPPPAPTGPTYVSEPNRRPTPTGPARPVSGGKPPRLATQRTMPTAPPAEADELVLLDEVPRAPRLPAVLEEPTLRDPEDRREEERPTLPERAPIRRPSPPLREAPTEREGPSALVAEVTEVDLDFEEPPSEVQGQGARGPAPRRPTPPPDESDLPPLPPAQPLTASQVFPGDELELDNLAEDSRELLAPPLDDRDLAGTEADPFDEDDEPAPGRASFVAAGDEANPFEDEKLPTQVRSGPPEEGALTLGAVLRRIALARDGESIGRLALTGVSRGASLAVLFDLRDGAACAHASTGASIAEAEVTRFRLPVATSFLLREAVERQAAVWGTVDEDPLQQVIAAYMRSAEPAEACVVPIEDGEGLVQLLCVQRSGGSFTREAYEEAVQVADTASSALARLRGM